MKVVGKIATIASLLWLVACGGGGGNASKPDDGTGPGANGTLTVQAYGTVAGADAAISNFASSDLTVHAKATLKDKAGAGIANAIVKFSESGAGILTFAPESATALTNASGIAEVELKASSLTALGATQLVAEAAITDKTGAEVTLSGKQNVSVSAAVIQDPQAVATALNFKGAVPADQSIVIAGAGGNGRSETALLTFTVVDNSGAPIKGVVVDFSVVPAGAVVLNTTSGTSNSSGEITASVNSKSQPTSVIVKATVRGRNIGSQSDTLTVTTGVSTQLGFDLSASKFNLDADLSGDSSTLNVKIVDKNGNPVADGVPVVAQTPYGRVGTSGRGGCTTTNGGCSVEYQVQNPRPDDGVKVPVVFSTQTGQGTLISDTLHVWVTSVGDAALYDASGKLATSVTLPLLDPKACKFGSTTLYIGTPKGLATPAGTVIAVRSTSELTSPTIVDGTPTLDRAAGRTALTVTASGKAGTAAGTDTWSFKFTAAPSKTVSGYDLKVNYPECPKEEPETPTGPTNPGSTATGGGSV